MKKIITALLSTTLIFVMCLGFVSCNNNQTLDNNDQTLDKNKQNLELTEYEVALCRESNFIYKNLILEIKGMDSEQIQALDITAVSKNENIATIVGLKIHSKNIGTTEVVISYNDKEANLKVNVLSVLDYLKIKMEEGTFSSYKTQYKLCTWFLNQLYNFKNPSSVEILEIYVHENSENESDGFAIKLRAQNGFGGMNIENLYLTSYGLSELGFTISSEPLYMFARGFSGSIDTEYINLAIEEELNQ